MAFQGYPIFPGFSTIGVVSPAILEMATTFNLSCLDAMQNIVDEDVKWASEISGVTPAVFKGKVPLDFTALDGFEPYKGVRTYKQIDVVSIEALVDQYQRNIEWDIRLGMAGMEIQGVYNVGNLASSLVQHCKVMQARLAATVFMQGTPTTALAKVYAGNNIPGAGLPLFSSAATTGGQFANPLEATSRKFDNYYPAAGAFSSATFATMRTNMRMVPSPVLSAETLGLQVTDVIGPSYMEEPFRQVMLQNLGLQTATVSGTPVAGATTNIYTAGSTPWKYWIAPQLDADPYVVANPGKHMWIAVSRKLIGAHPIEMVAPTSAFTPRIQLFGDGTEMAALTSKIRLMADLFAGAAAGLPHTTARYEQS